MKIASFGEIMLRLTCEDKLKIIQSNKFDISFAGAEANVSLALANWGVQSSFISILPKNELGELVIADLKKYSVDDSLIIQDEGRLGILFLEGGANQRGSKVIYDRKNSTFSNIEISYEWFLEKLNGYDWLHWTGITPSLSEVSLQNCKNAIKAANNHEIVISTDLNFRNKLWDYGKKANEIMPELLEFSKIIIGNEEDADKVLGIKPKKTDVSKGVVEIEAYRDIAEQVYNKFPRCEIVAFSLRESLSADHNRWSGVLFNGKDFIVSPKYDIKNIVDRVGSGDSFAAGLIYGLQNKESHQDALNFAVAASCLKHSISGDYCLASISEVNQLMDGNFSGRINR